MIALHEVEGAEVWRSAMEGMPGYSFFITPFEPLSAIFLTAILEHDSGRPSSARMAAAGALRGIVADHAGDPPELIVPEALSAIGGAVEPFSVDVLANRLIGPPAQLQSSPSQIAEATFGGTPRQTLRSAVTAVTPCTS